MRNDRGQGGDVHSKEEFQERARLLDCAKQSLKDYSEGVASDRLGPGQADNEACR